MKKIQILTLLFLALFLAACSKMSEIDKLKETCDLEEMQACEKLTQIYQKDCDNNNSQSCFELGKLYENPAIRDLNKARAYFVKADSLGLAKAKTYISFIDYGFAPATFSSLASDQIYHNGRWLERPLSKNFLDGGFIDHTGKWAIKPQFNDIYPFKDGFAKVEQNYKIGLINQEGEVIVRPKFDDMGSFREGLAWVLEIEVKNHWNPAKELRRNLNEFFSALRGDYFNLLSMYDSDTDSKNEKKYGFINKSGKVVIDLEFDDVYNFREGLAAVRKGEKWGFIDKNGEWVIKAKFDDVSSFSDETAAFKLDDKWGIIDKQGKIIIEPQLEWKDIKNKSMYKFKANNKFGLMDENGKVILEPTMDDIVVKEHDNYAKLYLNQKLGFIDKSGKIFVKPEFDDIYFDNNTINFKLDNKWGFMDKNGNIIVQAKFDNPIFFSEGLATVRLDNKWGYINEKGEMIIQIQFDNVVYFREGLAAVEIDHKWGFINKDGKMIIEPRFASPQESYTPSFYNGYVDVYLDENEESIWINTKGKVIKDYEPVESEFGLTKVKMLNGSGFGVVDTNGNFVLKPTHDKIALHPNGFIKMMTEYETCGLMNAKRKLFIEPIFDDISVDDFLDDKKLIRFIANGSYGFMDQKGNIIIKGKFTKAGSFSNF